MFRSSLETSAKFLPLADPRRIDLGTDYELAFWCRRWVPATSALPFSGGKNPAPRPRGKDAGGKPAPFRSAPGPPAPAETAQPEPIADRQARKEAIRSDNAERKVQPEQRDRRPRRHRDDDDDGNTTVGFGDETPAFMMVSAKV